MSPIFEKIVDLLRGMTELAKKAVDQGDGEKFVKNVNELALNVDETYAHMREIIMSNDKLSVEEKLEKLEKLAEQQMAAKQKCEEAIKGNREHVAKITLDVVKGLLTCGVSFAPAIIKELKKTSLISNEQASLLTDGQATDD